MKLKNEDVVEDAWELVELGIRNSAVVGLDVAEVVGDSRRTGIAFLEESSALVGGFD